MSKNCVAMRIAQNGGGGVRKYAIFRVDHVASKDEFSVRIGKKIYIIILSQSHWRLKSHVQISDGEG